MFIIRVMKADMSNKTKAAYITNYFYSILYIAATGTDKYYYRDHSKIHEWLVSLY